MLVLRRVKCRFCRRCHRLVLRTKDLGVKREGLVFTIRIRQIYSFPSAKSMQTLHEKNQAMREPCDHVLRRIYQVVYRSIHVFIKEMMNFLSWSLSKIRNVANFSKGPSTSFSLSIPSRTGVYFHHFCGLLDFWLANVKWNHLGICGGVLSAMVP